MTPHLKVHRFQILKTERWDDDQYLELFYEVDSRVCPVLVSQPFPCSPTPNEFGRLLKWKEGNNVLQHSIGFNSGKYDQIIPAVLLVFHFPVCGRQEGRKAHKDGLSRSDYVSMAWHWLQMHIWESPVKPVICCLYQRFVPPPPVLCLSAIQPQGKHMQKGVLRLWSVFLLKEPQLSDFCLAAAPKFCLPPEELRDAPREKLFEVCFCVDEMCRPWRFMCFVFFLTGITSSCLKIRSLLCVTL